MAEFDSIVGVPRSTLNRQSSNAAANHVLIDAWMYTDLSAAVPEHS
jgi:hypothetical protein